MTEREQLEKALAMIRAARALLYAANDVQAAEQGYSAALTDATDNAIEACKNLRTCLDRIQ